MSVAAIVFKGEHHGFGISYWIDRVVPYYGLFDLRASLAGEVLGLPMSQKKIRSHLREPIGSNFANVRSQEKS
jgi:hypothetical protein